MEQTDTRKIFPVLGLENVGMGTDDAPSVCRAGCMRRSILSSTPACRQKMDSKLAACRVLEVLASGRRLKRHLFPEGLADIDKVLADVARHQHAVVGQCERDA